MTRPVTRVGKPSSVARSPRSVLCSPAPSMSTPIPKSSGQFLVIVLNGTARPMVISAQNPQRTRQCGEVGNQREDKGRRGNDAEFAHRRKIRQHQRQKAAGVDQRRK